MKTSIKTRTRHLLGALALAALTSSMQAQLVSSWTAPSVDDGNPITNFVASWLSDVSTGTEEELVSLFGSGALAADNVAGRLYSAGSSLSTFEIGENGGLVKVAGPTTIKNANGIKASSGQVQSMGYANGTLYASMTTGSSGSLSAGLYAVNPTTTVATLIKPAAELPVFSGMDYNTGDGLMYGILGVPQAIVRFDLTNFNLTTVATVPTSAYNGVTGTNFDGLAVGDGKVYLTHGLNSKYGNIPIAVYDIAAGTFGSLKAPVKTAENRFYRSGATYFPALSGVDLNPGPPPTPTNLVATVRTTSEVLLSWDRNQSPDFDRYAIYRSSNGGEFVEIGTNISNQFFDKGLGGGVTYSYFVTAIDTTGLESAPSTKASVTLGAVPSISISSISPSIVTDSRGRSRGRAVISVVNESGAPASSASVTVKFSGSFNETLSGFTGSNGTITFTTAARVTGAVSFQVCVDKVSQTGRIYDPSKNVETCDSF
jgi:hypothetical protein